jgi:hypothetical protein
LANANNNQSQFQWIVTCNHHDESRSTLALGKPTKLHIICPRTLLYYLFISVRIVIKYGPLSCGKISSIFNTESFTPCLHILAFEPVTSAKQISSPKTALNATAEMQLSADISQNLGTQLIFKLIYVSISNKDEMCSASQLAMNEHRGLFNDKTVSTFRLIVRLKQQYQSKMQRDLVDFSSSKTISNAKLANNDFQLIVDLFLIPNHEGARAVRITRYSASEGD